MGLDINDVLFLLDARRRGAELGEVVTLGRQDLNVYPKTLAKVLAAHGLPTAAFLKGDDVPFAESVFLSLGAKRVYSLDASGFEGAEFIHDLNEPVPPDFRERFDTVYDGGTLEHVFNFPLALKNCMEMVRVGGRFLMHTCANNWCGHGFFQFSPELFFRALGSENGFEVERVVVHPVGPYGRWFEVLDPAQIRARVEVITFSPLQMFVHARRVCAVPVFSHWPQQSDYTPRWEKKAGNEPGQPQSETPDPYVTRRPWLSKVLPSLARVVNVVKMGVSIYHSHSLWNRRLFRPVKKR